MARLPDNRIFGRSCQHSEQEKHRQDFRGHVISVSAHRLTLFGYGATEISALLLLLPPMVTTNV